MNRIMLYCLVFNALAGFVVLAVEAMPFKGVLYAFMIADWLIAIAVANRLPRSR